MKNLAQIDAGEIPAKSKYRSLHPMEIKPCSKFNLQQK
jgi:hypothetical protein